MKKILVVDDDLNLRTALVQYLQDRGYSTVEATSGKEGLRLFEQHQVDLVISDVAMPDMDGMEFCGRLRSTYAGQLVPFLFLSAKGAIEDRVQGHSIGADDYLLKPFEPRELIAKLEAQFERSRRTHFEIVRMMQNFTGESANSRPHPLPLTPAEEKVFWEVVRGYTNKQIGDRLFVSPRTVQTHLSNILAKLKLENRAQLVRYAFEQGYKMPEEDGVTTA